MKCEGCGKFAGIVYEHANSHYDYTQGNISLLCATCKFGTRVAL